MNRAIAKKIKSIFAVSLAMIIILLLAGSVMALEVPDYHGYINDYAGMISPGEEQRLERALQSFDLSDSTQIAVLTIDSLEGENLEDFSIRVVDRWQVGQKDKDNGVLLLVAKKERKVRIEVGRGLEAVLTDLLSGRIIDNVITPQFKAGLFDEGFAAGLGAIIQATRGEFKGGDNNRRAQQNGEPSPLFKFLFFATIFIVFLGFNSKKLGIAAGALLFPLAFVFGLAPTFSLLLLFIMVTVGALGAGWLLPLVIAGALRNSGSRGLHTGYYGGFGGGGFGGFGGGGFGGGGASGGW